MCERRFAFYGSQTMRTQLWIGPILYHTCMFKSMLESQVTPNCCVNMCLRPPLMQLQHSTKSWRPDLVFLPRNSHLVSMFRLHWLMSFYVANRTLVYLPTTYLPHTFVLCTTRPHSVLQSPCLQCKKHIHSNSGEPSLLSFKLSGECFTFIPPFLPAAYHIT